MGGVVTPTQQATAATEELKRKTEENIGRAVTDSWKKAGESALAFTTGMTGAGLGLAEAGRFAKESIVRFADFEEGMIRIRQATNATAEQQSRLGDVFHQVARETGEDVVTTEGKFLDFAERSRLPLDDMIKLFPQMSRQAFLAGTDIEVVGRLVNDAVSGMNVPIERVPALLEDWNKTLRSVEPEFLTFLQRSESQLQSLHLTGEKNLTALSGVFSELSAAAGGGRRGAFRAAQEHQHVRENTDPYQFVLSVDLYRRHLTNEQKAESRGAPWFGRMDC
jgi:hypothetical protein